LCTFAKNKKCPADFHPVAAAQRLAARYRAAVDQHLAAAGWTVYASARRLEAIEHLKDAGCRTLELDVTDEASMRAAVEEVQRAEGAVGVLVNNAGYSQGGAIEQVPPQRRTKRRTRVVLA